MPVESEIAQIKNAMLEHNKADDVRFAEILNKLDKNHDVHVRNEETLKQILAQATKTNGRVSLLEDMCKNLDKSNALLHQIVSQQHGQYEKWVTQQEKLQEGESDKYVTKEEFKPIKGFVYTTISIICTAVLMALLGFVLIKSGEITITK